MVTRTILTTTETQIMCTSRHKCRQYLSEDDRVVCQTLSDIFIRNNTPLIFISFLSLVLISVVAFDLSMKILKKFKNFGHFHYRPQKRAITITRQHTVGSTWQPRVSVGRYKHTTRSSKIRRGFRHLCVVDVHIKPRNYTTNLQMDTRHNPLHM